MPLRYYSTIKPSDFARFYKERLEIFLLDSEGTLTEIDFLRIELPTIKSAIKFFKTKDIVKSAALMIFYKSMKNTLKRKVVDDDLKDIEKIDKLLRPVSLREKPVRIERLTKNQVAILFHFLQKTGLIKNYSPTPLSHLVQHLTGFAEKQLYEDCFLRINDLISKRDKYNQKDLESVIEVLLEVIELIKQQKEKIDIS
jgi:hypothetical protein